MPAPQLQNFSASSRGLLGNLPSFESCKSISTIDLGRNNLYGTVPKSVSKCQTLVTIKLSENNLTGQIPEELANIHILESVDLSNNK
jgi:Leucine-rich repeat (LRR) protein